MKARFYSLLFALAFFAPWSALAAFTDNASFAKAITSVADEVTELKVLQNLAKQHKVKVHLFGGTAAGLANFAWIREDARDNPKKYLQARLEPRFDNIFPGTKDLDVVIDGPVEAIDAIRKEMESRFPRFLPDGKKTAWEFRPLRYADGVKAALLNDSDFMAQHNDSLSTSLIDIADAKVTNLLEPVGKKPDALLDSLRSRQLEYYFSPGHQSTKRFVAGMNPPIISVVRALTKAFEYGLEIRPADEARFRETILSFEPTKLKGYPRSWLENNGPKLVQNSADTERSYRVLRKLGLQQALSQFGSTAEDGTLAWWMDKEPLPRLPLATDGKTAKELGLTTVAHSTKSYRAFQMMSLSPSGKPNVFISRKGSTAEAAAFGNGFYVAEGNVGAWGSNYSLVYDVDPSAREGKDFDYVKEENGQKWLVFRNESALKRREAKSDIPLMDRFLVLTGQKEGGGDLPPKEYFESRKPEFLRDFQALPREEKIAFEKKLLRGFPADPDFQIFPLIREYGGLQPETQVDIIYRAIEGVKTQDWPLGIQEQVAPFIDAKNISRRRQEQIRDLITQNTNLGVDLSFYLSKLDKDIRLPLNQFLERTFLDNTIDKLVAQRPGARMADTIQLIQYGDFPIEKVERLEDLLWNSWKSGEYLTVDWESLLTRSKLDFEKILKERLPYLIKRYRGEFPEWTAEHIIMKRGSDSLKRDYINLITAELKKEKVHPKIVDLGLQLEEKWGVKLALTPKEKYLLIMNTHLYGNPEDPPKQGWGRTRGAGDTFEKSLYDRLADSIERDHPTPAQRMEGAKVFNYWMHQIDPKRNPGLGTGHSFLRTFQALEPVEQAPYYQWVTAVANAKITRTQDNRDFERFTHDGSPSFLASELAAEIAESDPTSVQLIHELDQANLEFDYNLNKMAHRPEPNTYKALDRIAQIEGADGLIRVLRAMKGKWRLSAKPGTIMQAFTDRILLNPEWAKRPDLIIEAFRAMVDLPFPNGVVEEHFSKLDDVLFEPHWRNHPELKKLLGEAPDIGNMQRYVRGLREEDCGPAFAAFR